MKLRLKQLAFDRILFEVSEDFDAGKYNRGRDASPMGHDFEDAQVGIKFQVLKFEKENFPQLEEEHFPYDIQLTVTGKPKEGSEFPYTFEISASAMFILQDDNVETSTEEQRLEHCRQRGVGQLISPIREMLASLSSQSYFGDVRLPMVNVTKMLAQATKVEETQE
ncbi:hypothetical protein [Paraburkholderia sp.]|uniref:hypothetical protein n=1 Tax=Paraburkholderia sp. TaxID=1926495 RepID=UPI00286EF344|nr:hypothetical protein [Paraburkholderia sp.]